MEQPKRDTKSNTLKRVILLHGSFNQVSGVERIVLEEARYFLEQGVETHVLTYELPTDVKYTTELLNQVGKAYTFTIEEIAYKKASSDVMRKLNRILALRRRIKEIRPDIIIAQEMSVCPALYLATIFTRSHYVAHVHDVPFQSYVNLTKYALMYRRALREIRTSQIGGQKKFILLKPSKIGLLKKMKIEVAALFEYLGVRKAIKIFTLSNQVKWMVKTAYGKDAIVIKGAFSADKLRYQPKRNIKERLGLSDKVMILNINSLHPVKRVDLLLRAFKQLATELKDAALIIGGIGSEKEKLTLLTEELNIADKVKFVGYIPEDELWDYYAACDVFVSVLQGDFALAPYEALALQKKVVVPEEMEVDEYLANNRHLFVAVPTVDGLAKVMLQALATDIREDDDLSEYAWDRYVEKIYAACQEAKSSIDLT